MRTLLLLVVVALSSLSGCERGSAVNSMKVGDIAPALATKTLADVDGDFSRITSYRYPDERMYEYSLDDAMKTGKLIVLEFATPGHCTVCDKQLQMLKGLLAVYGDDVLFLHMDQYQNPEAFKTYRIMGDPWTYIIDEKQRVKYKQAGRVLYGELEYQIKKALGAKLG